MPEPAADVGRRTDVLEVRLSEILTRRAERSHAFSAPYAELWEALARMAAGGKRIRPRMLMDAHEALGGTDRRSALDAACAMELLHLALVIHDDVIDRDLVRRGEMNITGRFAADAVVRGASPEAARAWGEASSLLAGDLVLTAAHSLLARLNVAQDRREAILDVFDDAVFESAAGEHDDVWLSLHLEEISPREVLEMADRKTASYSFAAPLLIAAILAGAGRDLIAELSTIARLIGVVYQLRDDVLGLFGDERQTGKSALSDLRAGKETLLVAYARSDPAWAAVGTLFGDADLSVSDAQLIRSVIEESGATIFVESMIAERCDEVDRLVRASGLPEALREQLLALTRACVSRNS
ncbi:polyprenyl synthetase family protein [Microbacterium sp. 69-10]|uniref:polyprenyl synthetase family protein n=1 Tax=Microbacterium sp. 69-10 TaxID=1895783 RepID=UPI0025CBC316|nr:polyprenyl synthetase family protein [Microbacterium sp. 69-10]